MTEAAPLTFANICLDVQIVILTFLHPSDILALRKTCKTLQRCTQKRVVWVAALHRVCLDNALFLPSFPISDMSDLELEKSAMAPRRWINLCGAFKRPKSRNHLGEILRPRATRIIDGPFATELNYDSIEFFIVPGGRYLLSYSPDIIFVLDLGYTSSPSAECKPIASVKPKGGCDIRSCKAQATPDGMGLTIFTSNANSCSIYEIYPQSETPHLTLIGHLDFDVDLTEDHSNLLLPGTVFWVIYYEDMVVLRVWDYLLNHSISFSLNFDFEFDFKVMATKTAVIVICEEGILILAIPPLSPRSPNFFDRKPTHILPLFTIPFPDGILNHSEHLMWKMLSSWYFGSKFLYFDLFRRDSKLYRFQIILKPDLSTASLHVINFSKSRVNYRDMPFIIRQDYRICEDTHVSCWFYSYHNFNHPGQYQCGVYSGLKFTRFGVISHGGSVVDSESRWLLTNGDPEHFLYACPASGRSVLLDTHNHCVVVFDFF